MMKNALGATLAVEKYGSVFFKNGAQPMGVLEHPSVVEDPERLRREWSEKYGGTNNAHKVVVLEEGMHFSPISLPPEDSQFLSTREFGVEEICRIFRVPPHMVQSLKRATFSNIEHQSIDFVVHTLDPWLVRIEQAITKDLLLENEKDAYYPKFNVDGLLRGDAESRMKAYAQEITNGFLSPNDARRKENLPPIPDDEGGNFFVVNGSYVRLRDVGAAYINSQAPDEHSEEALKPEEPVSNPEEEEQPKRRQRKRH